MYKWINIDRKKSLDELCSNIPQEYAPAVVAERLKTGLSKNVRGILIEKYYVDKDYRSTYYNFYSKKGQRYTPDCVRLHFFDDGVKFNNKDYSLSCDEGNLGDYYFGYMVLRPTGIVTIGRSVLCSSIRADVDGYVIKSSHKVHLLGHELIVKGMPSMDQHIDISVCAHAACWSILRHYSERYNLYREHLTYDITLNAHEFDPGGLLPSKGLNILRAERVLQAANTYPILIVRRDLNDDAFYKQLHAYTDSGFPIFAAMHDRKHAVAVVGYNWSLKKPQNAVNQNLSYVWDKVVSFLVVDDNHLPYLKIDAHEKTPEPDPVKKYSAIDIDSFIVPLPEKIYYSAEAVDQIVPNLYNLSGLVKLPAENETVVRYFITTGARLKNFVKGNRSQFSPNLYKAIMALPFAQFVWVVEFATHDEWSTGNISARAVIDATASVHEKMPLWLFHNREKAIVFDRWVVGDYSRLQTLVLSGMEGALTRMEKNLETAKAA